MAKSCSVCHQSFDDQLEKCPHCGAPSEASTAPKAPGSQEPDDVAIDWNLTDIPASASSISHIKSPMAKAVEPPDTEEDIDIQQAGRDDGGSEVRLGESAKKDSTGELSSLDPIRAERKQSHPDDSPSSTPMLNPDIEATIQDVSIPAASGGSSVDLERTIHDQPGDDLDVLGKTILDEALNSKVGRSGESSAVDLGSARERVLSEDVEQPSGNIPAGAEPGDSAFAIGEELAADAKTDSSEHAVGNLESAVESPSQETFSLEALDETAAASKSDKPVRPAKKARAKVASRAGAVPWVGGGAIGVAASIVLFGLLWALGALPGKKVQMAAAPPAAVPQAQPEPHVAARPSEPKAVEAPREPAETVQSLLDRGEFDRLLAQPRPETPDSGTLAARGEARWLLYLKQQSEKNQPIKADDEGVKQARTDLENAKSAQGLFWLGQIEEGTGNLKRAREVYQSALNKFQDNALEARVFQAALDRLDATEPSGDAQSLLLPVPTRQHLRALLADAYLAKMLQALIALQDQPATRGGAKPAPATTDNATKAGPASEAGFDFWKAVRLAKQGDYESAVQALSAARAIHSQRRFQRLKKNQNPLSDPTEEIFLKSCDELISAWQVRAKLQQSGLASSKNPVKAISQIMSAAAAQAESAAALHAAVEKVAKDPAVNGATDPAQVIASLAEAQEKSQAQLALVRDVLSKANMISGDTPLSSAVDRLVKQDAETRQLLASLARNLHVQATDDAIGQQLTQAIEKLQADVLATRSKLAEALGQIASQGSVSGPAESGNSPNRMLAEEHYEAGHQAYWQGNYKAAAREFDKAIREAGQPSRDARYLYYLGLARFQQGDEQEAREAFQQASTIERDHSIQRPAVNGALERVQGQARAILDTYRP
jgi:tetratricopeptide (TPR) repeat protein